jgi:hypothetical protein
LTLKEIKLKSKREFKNNKISNKNWKNLKKFQLKKFSNAKIKELKESLKIFLSLMKPIIKK